MDGRKGKSAPQALISLRERLNDHRIGNIGAALTDRSLRAETQVPVLRIGGLREKRMTYTLEETERMVSALRALPPVDGSKRRLTKQAAVQQMAAEIRALQARGYTIEQVVESLHGVGFDITTPTLKSYLQRIKKRNGKKTPRGQRPSDPPVAAPSRERPAPPATMTEPKAPAVTEPRADAPVKRTGKDAFLVEDKKSY
jgi:hypothetical protein